MTIALALAGKWQSKFPSRRQSAVRIPPDRPSGDFTDERLTMFTDNRDTRRRSLPRRLFYAAIITALVVGPATVVAYWLTGPYSFFWPGYLLAGLAIATGVSAVNAFPALPGDMSEYAIKREVRRTLR
jgi:hypothetical protein